MIHKKTTHARLLIVLFAFIMLCIPPASEAFSLSTAPTYGTGKVQVRLYTSYFCGPCRAVEPYIEPLLQDLVRRNIITLTYVDIPSHKIAAEYASAFLCAVQGKGDIKTAMTARRCLMEAATSGVKSKDQLESFLRGKGILLTRLYDPSPTFKTYNAYIQQDRIRSTPTCVITDPATGSKNVFDTGRKIMDALKRLNGRDMASK